MWDELMSYEIASLLHNLSIPLPFHVLHIPFLLSLSFLALMFLPIFYNLL